MELYALYNAATGEWYKRGYWRKTAFEKHNLWRQRGPMKLALIYLASTHRDIPNVYDIEKQVKAEYPDMDWRKVNTEANKRAVLMLPDTYQIYKHSDDGPVYVGTLKEWY